MSSKLKKSPELIKKQIEKLEMTVETEVLSYNKEKQIMKEIKDLKKIYLEGAKVMKINNEINEKVKE